MADAGDRASFPSVVEAGESAVLLFGVDGRLLDRSPAAASLLGIPPHVLRAGVPYGEVLRRVAGQSSTLAAALPAAIPPAPEGGPRRRGPARVPVIAELLALGTTGFALTLREASPEDASALRGSEQRYREFAEMASDWQWEQGPDLRFTGFSDSYLTVEDYPPSYMIGRTRWEVVGVDPDAHEHWRRHRDDLLARRPFWSFCYSDTDHRGHTRHFRVSGRPIFAADGSFQGYRGIAYDDTARVEALRRAERAEALLREAIGSIPHGFMLYDENERLVLFNRAIAEQAGPNADLLVPGRTYEEMLRATVARQSYLGALGREDAFIAERLAGFRSGESATTLERRDGLWIEARNTRMANGYTLALRSNVTERVLAARKLADFAEMGSDWQWETDGEFRFTGVSERYAAIDDLLPEALMGRTRWELQGVDPELDANWRRHLDDCRAHRPFRDFRCAVHDAKGRVRHFRVSGNPIFRHDGGFLGYRGVTHDETAEIEARHRAERAEMLLGEAIASVPEGIMLFDPQDRLILFNHAIAEEAGTNADLLVIGTSYEDLVRSAVKSGDYPASVGHEEDYIAERLAAFRDEARVTLIERRGDRWIEARNRRTAGGYTVALRADMTERVIAARKLAELAELASDWQWELDAQLRFTHVSERYLAIDSARALPLEQLIGKTRWEVEGIDPDQDETWRRHREDLLAQRPFRDFRCRVRDAAGRERHFRISGNPIFGPDGIFEGYRGVTHDETAEIEARHRAERAERLLSNAIACMPEGLIVFDPEGRLVLFNEAMREMASGDVDILKLGRTAEEMLRLGIERGIYPQALGREKEFITERLAAYREPGRVHLYRRTPDLWVEARNVRTSEGYIVGVRHNVTERERRQQALIQAKEEAEYASRSKSDFLANVSHELRTPLNAVIGFSEMLMLEYFGALTAKQREYLEDIRASGTFLLSIIDDVLDLTKLEMSKEQLAREHVRIAELVESCCRMVYPRFAGRGPRLKTDVARDLPAVVVDSRKMRQILINLLTNAFKFTPAEGSVIVRAQTAGEGWMEIAVSDTGIGISPDDLPRVMEPFYRAEGPFARRSEGTGLGLPLAKALAELHGGELMIASEVGSGTTATLRLPPSCVLAEGEAELTRPA